MNVRQTLLSPQMTGILVLCAINLTLPASTSASEKRSYTATLVTQAPQIDGRLEKEFWDAIPATGNFTQRRPYAGQPASESTLVKLCFDERAIYVAFYCYDTEPEKIVHNLCKRDSEGNSDMVEIDIDSYHDHRTAYVFVINAAGVLEDDYRYDDTNIDVEWNAVWEGEAYLTEFGWTAEMRIPLACLRFNKQTNKWGVNFFRYIARKNETSIWSYIPLDVQGWVSRFGHLEGMKVGQAKHHAELLPYVAAGARFEPTSSGNQKGPSQMSNIGVDIKRNFASSMNLTLDITVNPDFGQVEADPAIINLTTYETFFPEKRPFFIEGSKYFETSYTLFYSRRIGRPPSLWPHDVRYYLERPKNTTILAAAKLVGRSEKGWVVGVMDAVTARENATYMDTSGIEKKTVVENEANYSVARLKKEFTNGSFVGIMMTGAGQRSIAPIATGGADWDLYFRDRRYDWYGQVIGSRHGEVGWGGSTGFSRNAGKHFPAAFGLEWLDKKINLNRLGYLRRNNYKGGWAWLQYRETESPLGLRAIYNNFNIWRGYNLEGNLIASGGNYNVKVDLPNNWFVGAGFEIAPSLYDDRETRGGPLYRTPCSWSFWVWGQTDMSKELATGLNLSWGYARHGRYVSLELEQTFRPATYMSFTVAPAISRRDNQWHWVTFSTDTTGQRIDVFGRLRSAEIDLRARGLIMFSKEMNFELYIQMLIGFGDYSNLSRLIPPHRFEPMIGPVNFDPDFMIKSLILNAVFRWEYAPGSTAYLIWTHNRGDQKQEPVNLNLRRDIGDLLAVPSDNAVMVKISYWVSR